MEKAYFVECYAPLYGDWKQLAGGPWTLDEAKTFCKRFSDGFTRVVDQKGEPVITPKRADPFQGCRNMRVGEKPSMQRTHP